MVSRSHFEELVIHHRDSAFNLAHWILQNREDAEDAVQDAYVRAFRAFDTCEGAGARAWLLAIVRNVAFTILAARKRSRKVVTLSGELTLGDDLAAVSPDPSPEAVVIVREGQRFLLDALTRLPPTHRDVLVLREMEGLSYAQISQITGVAIGTVMSRLSRARAELLRRVRGQCREPLETGVAAAHSQRACGDRKRFSPGSRSQPKAHACNNGTATGTICTMPVGLSRARKSSGGARHGHRGT